MPSAFSHAVAALSLGTAFFGSKAPARVWAIGAVCAALPDVDVIGFRFGVHYGDLLGHRGLTHSLVFAALLSAVVLPLVRSRDGPAAGRLWAFLFLATASHGFLDAFTNGGLGVAFFSPFDLTRYFFPFRPIMVAPISVARFFTGRGLEVLRSELIWVWGPSALLAAISLAIPAITSPAPRGNRG
jgi:inner membrane protein